MAATNDGNTDRHQQWYDPDLEEVNPQIRLLLESYSKVPSSEVVKHVNKIVCLQEILAATIRIHCPRQRRFFTDLAFASAN